MTCPILQNFFFFMLNAVGMDLRFCRKVFEIMTAESPENNDLLVLFQHLEMQKLRVKNSLNASEFLHSDLKDRMQTLLV